MCADSAFTSVMPKVWGSAAPQESLWVCSPRQGRASSSPAPIPAPEGGESETAPGLEGSAWPEEPSGVPHPQILQGAESAAGTGQSWLCPAQPHGASVLWAVGTSPLSLISNNSCLALASSPGNIKMLPRAQSQHSLPQEQPLNCSWFLLGLFVPLSFCRGGWLRAGDVER